jgi:hypothetical protein
MKKLINTARVEGYIYESTLEIKVSGPNSKTPGTEFISGELRVATDNAGINIIPIHFTYVTAITGGGKPNATFATLKKIIDKEVGTVMANGKDNAGMVRIDTAIGLNEFYSDKSGTTELVSAKRYEGGFVHLITALTEDEKQRNLFETDIVITGFTRKEADIEKNLPEKGIIKGAIFDFRKALMPVEFSVLNPVAIDYFESLGVSAKTPIFTKVKGRQISETVVKRIEEQSAFGEPSVREVPSTRKDYVITWAAQEPYEWDTEESMTVAELNEAITTRETYLATLKQRQDEYKASQGAAPKTAAPAPGAFNF